MGRGVTVTGTGGAGRHKNWNRRGWGVTVSGTVARGGRGHCNFYREVHNVIKKKNFLMSLTTISWNAIISAGNRTRCHCIC